MRPDDHVPVHSPPRISPQAIAERQKAALPVLVRLRRLTLTVTLVSCLVMATLQWTVGVNDLSGAQAVVFWVAGALAAAGLIMIKVFSLIPQERE